MKKSFLNILTTFILVCFLASANIYAFAQNNETKLDIHDKSLSESSTVEQNDKQIIEGISEPSVLTEPQQAQMLSSTVKPTGWLDYVSNSTISGWAWRSDIPNTPIDVHIYITNTSNGRQWVYPVTASNYRADLENAGYGNGNHGFSYSISWLTFPPGTYRVNVYAIGANNPELYGSPETFIVKEMEGSVDYLDETGMGGWAWKPNAPNTAIQVHIYIYKTNGTQVDFFARNAGQPRPDLLSLGYGDGEHGFTCAIPWEDMPEERLRVVAYMVDGSDYHPALCETYYDNRKPISLLGMTDEEGYDFSEWMTTSVVQDCYNIGTPDVNKYSGANSGGIINLIKESSYFVLTTHGSENSVEWCLHYGTEDEQRGYLPTNLLGGLPDDSFDTTRCVLLLCCSTGSGGSSNSDNFVNTLQSKGVRTVVGFEDPIYFTAYSDGSFLIDCSGMCWGREFTKALSEGQTVEEATETALDAVVDANELYELEHNRLYGLDSVYIAGDKNQIVKH